MAECPPPQGPLALWNKPYECIHRGPGAVSEHGLGFFSFPLVSFWKEQGAPASSLTKERVSFLF